MISRILATLIGGVLILYGIIAALSPLPLGVLVIVFGVLLIAAANPFARPYIRRMRKRWSWFNFLVEKIGTRSPERLRDVIEETEPDTDDRGSCAASGDKEA